MKINHTIITTMDFPRFTLVFLRNGADVLLLRRNKAPNRGLWNGIGGRLEVGEAPLGCAIRETEEESGFHLAELRYRGTVTWQGFEINPGTLYLFSGEAPHRAFKPCSEGELAWKGLDWMLTSPQVVSNIHRFGPSLFTSQSPLHFHFVYQAGEIQAWRSEPDEDSSASEI